MKKQVIAYPHFHWDREWYKEYEHFRFRLLKSFDIVLELLTTDKIPSFYFDGQTSALLDYLEIYPSRKALIKSLISEKRLFIGPFYCLVDEFLTSKEAFTKNIEIGLETAQEFGCTDFIAYFADTFGHSACTIPILNKFNIDKAIVWRGCGDLPAEFVWNYNSHNINTVNLIRGYFNDIFSTNQTLEEKSTFLSSNLDKIAEKSGSTLLLPIGADHLALPLDLNTQIKEINNRLENYEIILGSPFDYFEKASKNFTQHTHTGELRDNSKTFILEGCYSSRLDLKQLNTIASHKLNIADKICKKQACANNLIDYAYKLLIQNQAHDSICGCSTDDVHEENVVRYKKILQIAESIINDYKLTHKKDDIQVLNLSQTDFTGCLSFDTEKNLHFPCINTKRGFPFEIFNDINKIPVTEDYTEIYTYLLNCENQTSGLNDLNLTTNSDVFVTENTIGNSKVFAQIKNDNLYIGNNKIQLIDFVDMGDSYNFGPKETDIGNEARLKSFDVTLNTSTSSALELNYELIPTGESGFKTPESITMRIYLNAYSDTFNLEIDWNNTHKNHLLQLSIDTNKPITETVSEDLNEIIKRDFDPNYRVREHLPKEKGKEVRMNNAPMQRGVCANNVNIITCGITQYEVFGSELRIPLLRATGTISNPKNTARTTPAGPPIECRNLQQLGKNHQSIWVNIGTELKTCIETVYNECVVI